MLFFTCSLFENCIRIRSFLSSYTCAMSFSIIMLLSFCKTTLIKPMVTMRHLCCMGQWICENKVATSSWVPYTTHGSECLSPCKISLIFHAASLFDAGCVLSSFTALTGPWVYEYDTELLIALAPCLSWDFAPGKGENLVHSQNHHGFCLVLSSMRMQSICTGHKLPGFEQIQISTDWQRE